MDSSAEHRGPLGLLTRDDVKREHYSGDTFFLEAYDQLAGLTADPVGAAHDWGLLLLKPDAVVARELLSCVDWLVANGFPVVSARRVRLRRNIVRALWYFQWNAATAYRRRLADLFACSSDALLLVVRGPGGLPASVALTDRKGPTDPAARRPGELRHALGRYSFLLNLVHTADEPADVLRELGVQLDEERRATVFAEALDGADRADEARALARRLYAEVPARDLRFGPARDRLFAAASGERTDAEVRERLSAAVAAGGEDGLRELLETAWRHGLPLDPWDVVVTGSAVFPMSDPSRRPLLRSVSALDWADRAPVAAAIETGRGERR